MCHTCQDSNLILFDYASGSLTTELSLLPLIFTFKRKHVHTQIPEHMRIHNYAQMCNPHPTYVHAYTYKYIFQIQALVVMGW